MKNKPIHLKLIIAILVSITLSFPGSGCVSSDIQVPRGFAAYENGMPYRAVSHDGVMFRIRKEANEPHAELAFWKVALKKRMLDSGYYFIRESDIKATNKQGYLLELSAPVGQQDYAYMIAIFESGSRILIVETSGELSKVEARRTDIIAAIETLYKKDKAPW
jgi:hypothetical protein